MNKIAVGGVVGCNRAVVRRDLPGAVERFLGLVKSNPDIIIRRQKLFKKVNKQRFFFFFFFISDSYQYSFCCCMQQLNFAWYHHPIRRYTCLY